MIYSFFEPDDGGRAGLGTYIILDHIVRAGRAGLPYVYLGYWVEEAKRMAYKSKFRPLERLGPGGWRRFDPGAEGAAAAPEAALPLFAHRWKKARIPASRDL